jgi:bifunctional DNase/RNase
MAGRPRTTFVALVLALCAAGASWRLGSADPCGTQDVEMTAQRLVRVGERQMIVVLAEKHGSRRLAIPVTDAEAALIQNALRGGRGLGAATLDALGGRVVRATIDDATSVRDFRAHLFVAAGGSEIGLEASAGEALSLALQAGATIVADRALLDTAGVSPDDLRGRHTRDLRTRSEPAPVLGI